MTEDEAVTEANNSVYGLAGAVFSADLARFVSSLLFLNRLHMC